MSVHSRLNCHSINRGNEFFLENGYLQAPDLVQWMATLSCRFNCEHCLTVSRETGFSDMPLEKVRELIDEIAEMGVREFLVTGGEPLVREDLPEVINYLGSKGMNWTLNTAVMPSERLRKALARNSPGFVAVSLDGPREVHDSFRGYAGAWDEAVDAIRFFKSLEGVKVCAGTTVTSRNYDCLDDTFHLAVASGADQWGIHLLVPEGRAAQRMDLFLSKRQLKRLIRFVSRKRRYFHVEMADEIGYLGNLEPLVRDFPLTCGAGRSQCVILPDGEVVPCTTLDRSCSTGNIHKKSLEEIWATGFRELREWQPDSKCRCCDYFAACRAGCWLQRKAGTQCFRDVWHVPDSLKTAAGIAICLGGLAVNQSNGALCTTAKAKTEKAIHNTVLLKQVTDHQLNNDLDPLLLDRAIMSFYVELAAGLETGSLTSPIDPAYSDEMAWKFFRNFQRGTLPTDIIERCESVCNTLDTEHCSLSLIALLWRTVNEPLFEIGVTNEFSEFEREIICRTLTAIEQRANEWRLNIFKNRLNPYVSNGRQTNLPFFMYSKAGPRPGEEERFILSRDLNEERWGVGAELDPREVAEAYLLEHPFAEQMNLAFHFSGSGSLLKHTGEDVVILSPDFNSDSTCMYMTGIFDVIETDEDAVLSFEIKCILGSDFPNPYREPGLPDNQNSDEYLSTTIDVFIKGGKEYTYPELLNSIYQQQKDILFSIACDWLSGNVICRRNNIDYIITAIQQNETLLWPPIREIVKSGKAISTSMQNPDSSEASLPVDIDEIHRQAVRRDIDFWMF